ncbi:transposase [Rhizobacter sp. P5_C2]
MPDAKRSTRRRHDAELKARALEACAAPGASVAQVAMAHGLPRSSLVAVFVPGFFE